MRISHTKETKKPRSPDRRKRFLRDTRESQKEARQELHGIPSYPRPEPRRLSILEWAECVADAYTRSTHIDIVIDETRRRLPVTRRSIKPKELVKIWTDQMGHCWLTGRKLGLYELEDASIGSAAMLDFRRRSDGYTSGNMRIAASNVAMIKAFRGGQWFRYQPLTKIDYHAAKIHEFRGPLLCHIMEGLSHSRKLKTLPLTIKLNWPASISITIGQFCFRSFKLFEIDLCTITIPTNSYMVEMYGGSVELYRSSDVIFDVRDPAFGHEDIVDVVYSMAICQLTIRD